MTKMMFFATATFALLAVPAAAYQPVTDVPIATDAPIVGEKLLPDGTTVQERANTARLNEAQAQKAHADNVTYEQEVSAAKQEVAAEEATFVNETAAYEAEKARIAALSAEERIQWEADAAACKAGDTTRCAAPITPPR